jgi:hypothetical protein
MRSARSILALAGAALAAAACNAVLGLPDPALDDSIGKPDAGSPSAAASSTSTSTAGSGGGSATSSTAASSTAASGSGGAGGGAPPMPKLLYNARVRSIAVDATSIFWTEDLGEKVGRMNKDGSNQVALAFGMSNSGLFPEALIIDDTTVYWSAIQEIRSCPKTGCQNNPTVVISTVADGGDLAGLDGDDQFLYFASYDANSNFLGLAKVAKTGGMLIPFVATANLCAQVNWTHLVAGYLYFTCETGEVGRIATADAKVQILSMPASPEANDFVVAGGSIYYAQFIDQGSVFSLSTMGFGSGFSTIALNQSNTTGITADALYLYWLNLGLTPPDNGSGTLVRCSITDCNATTMVIAPDLDIPQQVVTDATDIYWSAWGNGMTPHSGIWKMPK